MRVYAAATVALVGSTVGMFVLGWVVTHNIVVALLAAVVGGVSVLTLENRRQHP